MDAAAGVIQSCSCFYWGWKLNHRSGKGMLRTCAALVEGICTAFVFDEWQFPEGKFYRLLWYINPFYTQRPRTKSYSHIHIREPYPQKIKIVALKPSPTPSKSPPKQFSPHPSPDILPTLYHTHSPRSHNQRPIYTLHSSSHSPQ